MHAIRGWWKLLSEVGVAYAPNAVHHKLIRLQNRIAFFSCVMMLIQSINFYRMGLNYAVLVNAGAIAAFIVCFILNAVGACTLSRFFYIITALFAISHHHLYFGHQAGFWLFLLNLTQAGFILFPQLSMRNLLLVGILISAGLVTLVLSSMGIPPLYEGMNAELAGQLFRNNLIRSPILLVLVGYYLVGENRESEGELAFAAIKAADAAKAKSFFLSNISHELRTPMNAIKGFSDILYELTNSIRDEKPQLEFKRHLSQIQISSANLTSIIDDLLDFARIESGHITFRKNNFDLRDVAENTMQTAEFYGHRSKGIETRLSLSPDLPRRLKGDPARLSQILLNLVGNAMKFTHKGHVELRARVVEETESTCRLCFEIEDTGIGIPGEKLPFLFDSLSSVSRETAVRYGGMGLGLAITKNLIEKQGGSITVMSSPGKGALFTVDLWFEKGETTESTEIRSGRDLKRARILVAEDNDVNQILIRTLLEAWNADIEIVENGLKALGEAQKNSYDLILMDLQMPLMDGMEASEQIRLLDDKRKKAVPIIALTADALSETRKKILAAGMNDIVTKPINQAELFAALRRGLNLVE